MLARALCENVSSRRTEAMRMARRLGGLLIFAFVLCAQRASAFLDPPYVTPQQPTVGELVSVSIVYGGGCDLVDYGIIWPPPITRQGNEITILLTGIHEGDLDFCYYGSGTATYPVGTFPAGTYTLDVERRYMGIGGDWIQETLGNMPFAVSGGPPQRPVEAPTLDMPGLASLGLALIALALLALRTRRA